MKFIETKLEYTILDTKKHYDPQKIGVIYTPLDFCSR